MSSYPPTPAFGGFNFVPQQQKEVPPAAPSNTGASVPASARRPSTQQSLPPTPSTIGPPVGASFRATMNPSVLSNGSSTSDSLEEGELSESQSRDSVSSNGMTASGDEELRANVDRPLTFEPPGNWNARYRSNTTRAQPGPYQGRNGQPDVQSMRNDRYGVTDRNLDLSGQHRGMTSDKGRGFPRASQTGFSRPANGQDNGAPKPSVKRLEAERAILDMRQCGVQFEDLVREGFDPNFLRQMFIRLELPVPNSNASSPAISNGQRNGVAAKEVVNSISRPQTSDKIDPDKEARLLRLKLEKERLEKEKKERLDKERKEAEAKAAELARQREAAREEEERRKREVEVLARQELFKKKMASMIPQKPASPGTPPTPISSTPVNAAIVEAHPGPIRQATSTTPSAQMIPGLMLYTEQAPKAAAVKADVVMKDAPAAASAQPVTTPTVTPSAAPPVVAPPAAAPPAAAVPIATAGSHVHPDAPPVTSPPVTPPVVPKGSNGVPMSLTISARRKRPMAADMYSEPNIAKRKFGAQRSGSLIIEVSEDEDDETGAVQQSNGNGKSPTGTPDVTPGGLRRSALTPSTQVTQSQRLQLIQEKELEIQKMKDEIEAAERRRKLSKAKGSTVPTPIATPPVGAGPSAPPSQKEARTGGSTKLMTPAKLAKGNQDQQSAIIENRASEEENARKAAEQALREEEQRRYAETIKAQQLLEEKRTAAKVEEEKRKKEEDETAKKKEAERERKRKQLEELHRERERKRLEREKLIAEEEKLRRQIEEMQREEEDIEMCHQSLAKDLEEVQQKTDNEPRRTEIEVKVKEVKEVKAEEAKKGVIEGSAEPQKSGEKQTPNVGGSTASAPDLTARPKSQPSTSSTSSTSATSSTSSSSPPANIANEQAQELAQVNGDATKAIPEALPEAIREVAKPASPLKAPTSAVTEPVDKMDIDVPEQSKNAEKAVDEDVEMTIEEEDSSSDDSDSSSDESSSDEEEAEEEEPSSDASEPKELTRSTASASPAVEKTNTQSQQQDGVKIVSAKKTQPYPNRFVPYTSPLSIFRSFRHHPQFHELHPNGLRSLRFSNKIDPYKQLCKYEVSGGVCNDSECDMQHFRQMTLKDDAILVELAENEGTTEEEQEKYINGLREMIIELKKRGEKDLVVVAKAIAAYRRKFLGSEDRVVRLQPRREAVAQK